MSEITTEGSAIQEWREHGNDHLRQAQQALHRTVKRKGPIRPKIGRRKIALRDIVR